MSISDRNTDPTAATDAREGDAFPEIPVRPDLQRENGAGVGARSKATVGDGASGRSETAASDGSRGRARDASRAGTARGDSAGARDGSAARADGAEPTTDERAHLAELRFNHDKHRWEHPETGAWWDEEAQAWQQETGAPAPPSWTPPALQLAEQPPPRRRPKLKKLRLLALMGGFGLLAAVSTVFGMMMAVASDLPALENRPTERNSYIYDRNGKRLGVMTGNDSRILVKENQIAPAMKNAIIAIEDRRFWENAGVDVRGIARALYQDVVQKRVVQGGSTITQQFVKQAMQAQEERTLFNKLREAALAFHLTRKWTKQKILREYLNSIYFGNGAYGIESAARTYFGWNHPGCGDGRRPKMCASQLEVHEAALLAGVVASPSAYDPVAKPRAATARRNLVLQKMYEQQLVTLAELRNATAEPIPHKAEISPPQETTDYPYFTSWVRQQVVDKMGARKAFGGGLRIHTTLDLDLQAKADAAVKQWLPTPGGPTASMVVLENKTGQVRAMVAGDSGANKAERLAAFRKRPFNLATQGQRQPGSSFKPFILAAALKEGISPDKTYESRQYEFIVPNSGGKEKFVVHNYEDNYAGISTLRSATTFSDNSVYAQVGIRDVGVKDVARLANRMGIRTPLSRNYALTLGAPKQGTTVLDMAHAYLTLATGGNLRYGRLSPDGKIPGPSGIAKIEEPRSGKKWRLAKLPDGKRAEDVIQNKRVLPQGVAEQATSILTTVIKQGTGKRADLGKAFAAGKTGTTEDYGDAWFVGFTKDYTVAVWVGYPDEVKAMKPPNFSFQGDPVAGGTYPASIWRTFMAAVIKDQNARKLARARAKALKEGKTPPETVDDIGDPLVTPPAGGATAPSDGAAPVPETGGTDGGGGGAPDGDADRERQGARPQDAQPEAAEPEPEQPGAAPPAPTQPPAAPVTPAPGATAPAEGGAVPPG